MKLMWFKLKVIVCTPYCVYGLLSAGILGHLWHPGHILLLDSPLVFNPNPYWRFFGLTEWPLSTLASTPLDLINHLITQFFPSWFSEKIMLWLIFFLCGLGAHRLLPRSGPGAYYAGLLYMINPFTYVRFVSGQWGVLWAYALIPFAVKAFLELLNQPSGKKAIKVAVMSTLVGLLQIHGYVLLFLIFIVLIIFKVVNERKHTAQCKRLLKYVSLSALLFGTLNAYWIVPALTGGETLLGQISHSDLLAFAPKATSPMGVAFDVVAMQGFWRSRWYPSLQDLIPCYWLVFSFILYLAVSGFLRYRDDLQHGWVVKSMSTVYVLGIFLALGASTTITLPVFEWFWTHFSFIRGFRDSVKFVALLCLAYAYLGGLEVAKFVIRSQEQKKKLYQKGLIVLIMLSLLVPFVYTSNLFLTYQQINVTEYPPEWHEVNSYINKDGADTNLLFLPWHQYMDYTWLPNRDLRISNPAHHFFVKPVIAGDNQEYGATYSQSVNPISKYVEFLLAHKDDTNNFGELLSPLNVKYVLLAKEVDYQSYLFLYAQSDLKVVLENSRMVLFENLHKTARSYAVNSIVYIDSLTEYLQLSKSQDVMNYLYIIGSGSNDIVHGNMEDLDIEMKEPVTYIISETKSRFIIFTVPQDVNTKYWQYNGQLSLNNLGFMPAFKSGYDGGEVVYTRFYHVYLPSYAVSLAALIWVICCCIFYRRHPR